MKKLNLLFFLVVSIILNAQTITGKIFNESQPIPYAKIGVAGENIGAIADKDGNFQLNFDNIDRSKVVKIEVAGFEAYKTSVSDFVKTNPQNIQLKEKVRTIAEVKINPKKLVDRNWGVNTKTKSIMYSINPQKNLNFLGEIALPFTTQKRAKIHNINLNFARYSFTEPITINYVIYNKKADLPGDVVEDFRIAATITPEQIVEGVFSVDVSKENIWVNGDFFVSLQVMAPFQGYLAISAAPFRTGFMRQYFGSWEKVSIIAPAINIDVKVDKNYRNAVEELRKENSKEDEKIFIDRYKNH